MNNYKWLFETSLVSIIFLYFNLVTDYYKLAGRLPLCNDPQGAKLPC